MSAFCEWQHARSASKHSQKTISNSLEYKFVPFDLFANDVKWDEQMRYCVCVRFKIEYFIRLFRCGNDHIEVKYFLCPWILCWQMTHFEVKSEGKSFFFYLTCYWRCHNMFFLLATRRSMFSAICFVCMCREDVGSTVVSDCVVFCQFLGQAPAVRRLLLV